MFESSGISGYPECLPLSVCRESTHSMDIVLFYITTVFYGLASLGYLSYLAWMKKPLWKTSRALLIAGFLVHTASILARYMETGYTPVTNRYEAQIFFSWLLVAIYLLIQTRHTLPVLGAFVTPPPLRFFFSPASAPRTWFFRTGSRTSCPATGFRCMYGSLFWGTRSWGSPPALPVCT
jgi:hypothetical protein